MIEKLGRKLFLIGVLLATALLLLVIPERPIRMGLDIAGGTRLVYGLDFEAARASGAISPEETDAEVLSETIEIIRNRVDPDGVLEPVIRRAGSDRIEIQLPGTVDLGVAVKPVPLAREVPAEGSGIIQLGGEPAAYSAFPGGGGTVRIDAEDIRYGKRAGNELREIQRGAQGTAMQAHAAGAMVVLVSDDSIKNAIENLGDLRFYPVAEAANFSVLGTDANAEISKLRAWLTKPENAEVPIAVYNALGTAEGGAPDGLLWFPSRRTEANEGLTVARAARPGRLRAGARDPAGMDLQRGRPRSRLPHPGRDRLPGGGLRDEPAGARGLRRVHRRVRRSAPGDRAQRRGRHGAHAERGALRHLPDLGRRHRLQRPRGAPDGHRAALGLAAGQARPRGAGARRRDPRPGLRAAQLPERLRGPGADRSPS